MKKTVRFSSEVSANNFAEKVNGTVFDNRKQENFKSNFSVKFDTDKAPEIDPYGDWYEEASMDGSLAYNGSADDF